MGKVSTAVLVLVVFAMAAFAPSAIAAPPNDDFATPGFLSDAPRLDLFVSTDEATKEAGEPNHAGDPGGHSVWFEWTPQGGGVASFATCAFGGIDTLLAVYTGVNLANLTPVASSDDQSQGNCDPGSSALQFDAVAGTTYRIAVDSKAGATGGLILSLRRRPANDDLEAAEALGPLFEQESGGDNRLASKQPGEPNHAGNSGGHSVWFSWTPQESGPVGISTCALFEGLDPLLAVYRVAAGQLTPVASSDDSPSGGCRGSDGDVKFDAVAGTTYRIAVDGKNGTSGEFLLRLRGRPANDDFGFARELDPSFSVDVVSSSEFATKQVGEPNHAGDPGGHSVWFKWTPPLSGPVEISTCASSSPAGPPDPLLAVYTGTAVNSLTPVASDDDSPGGCQSSDAVVEFDAVAGATYRIAVDSKTAVTGQFVLRLRGRPANDDFEAAEILAPGFFTSAFSQTKFATKEVGEPNHAGDPGGHSVWFSWTPQESGSVEISSCPFGDFDPLLAVYTGATLANLDIVAATDNGAAQNCGGTGGVGFDAVAGTTYRIAVDAKGPEVGRFELRLEGPPANDDFADARVLGPTIPVSVTGDTRLAGGELGEPDHAGAGGTHSVWFSWTPDVDGPVQVSTCGFGFDAAAAIYTGPSLNALTQVAANDDLAIGQGCGDGASAASFDAVAGTTYRIAVDGFGGSFGLFTLDLEARPANDDFADAEARDLETADAGGRTTLATKQPGEPNHAGDPGGHSVWFSWTPRRSGSVELGTCTFGGGSLDTLLAVYTGAALSALTPVAANDDSAGETRPCSDTDSSVRFKAVAGTTYRIAVDGKGDVAGTFALSLESRSQNDDFGDSDQLDPTPSGRVFGTTRFATKQAGEPNHAGDPGGHSVWFSWTPQVSGLVALSACAIEDEADVLLGVYTGNSLGGLTSAPTLELSGDGCDFVGGAVEIDAVAGTTYRIAVDARSGEEGRFALEVVPLRGNDDFAQAETLRPALPTSGTADTRRATKQPGEPNHAGDPGGHSVWFSWTPQASGPVEASSCGLRGSRDSDLALYTGAALNALTPIAADDGSSPGRCSSVRFDAVAGTTYRIAVDGRAGVEGRFFLNLRAVRSENDDFANAEALPERLPTQAFGSNELATKQPGEPNHAGDPGGHSVWFSWTPQVSGPVVISACPNEEFETVVAAYTGSALNNLTPVASAGAAPGVSCGRSAGLATIDAVAGTTYRIAVDGSAGSSGSFGLEVAGRPENDDFGRAEPLGSTSAARFAANGFATKQPGEPNHAGDPGGHSVWFKWTAPRNQSVAVDTCGTAFDTVLAVYTGAAIDTLAPVVANDNGGGGCGTSSRLSFAALAGTSYKIAVDATAGGPGGRIQLRVVTAPTNDDFTRARQLRTGLPNFSEVATPLATKQPGEPNHAGSPGGHSVWFSWTALRTGLVSADTCSSDFDTVLAVYTGASVNALTQVAANDDSEACGNAGIVFFKAIAGTTYRLAVDGVGDERGNAGLSIGPAEPRRTNLSIAKLGSGAGTVSSAPAGIDCGPQCSRDLVPGTVVTLTATPAAGSTFTGWSGAGCTGTGTCRFKLGASDKSVTATFAGQPGVPPAPPVPPIPPTPTPKPLRCKPGFQKKKSHGKVRCVKKKKPAKKKKKGRS